MKKGLIIAVAALVMVAVVASAAFLVFGNPGGSGQSNNENSPDLSPQTGAQVVTISYSKGARCPVGELIVDVSIKNSGYSAFTISGSSFVATANNIAYHYDFSGSKLLGWQNVNIPNGESYNASIVFKVPEEYSTFVLSYEGSSTDYNIVCQPE